MCATLQNICHISMTHYLLPHLVYFFFISPPAIPLSFCIVQCHSMKVKLVSPSFLWIHRDLAEGECLAAAITQVGGEMAWIQTCILSNLSLLLYLQPPIKIYAFQDRMQPFLEHLQIAVYKQQIRHKDYSTLQTSML